MGLLRQLTEASSRLGQDFAPSLHEPAMFRMIFGKLIEQIIQELQGLLVQVEIRQDPGVVRGCRLDLLLSSRTRLT